MMGIWRPVNKVKASGVSGSGGSVYDIMDMEPDKVYDVFGYCSDVYLDGSIAHCLIVKIGNHLVPKSIDNLEIVE